MSSVKTIDDFRFQKNRALLNGAGSTSLKVSLVRDPRVALALAKPDGHFGPDDIDLADVTLAAGTPNPIEFARGTDTISFTAEGSTFAGFGVYHSGAALLAKLGQQAIPGDPPDDFSLAPIEFGESQALLLGVIRWGFSANGKVNGAMALGAAGQATLAVSGGGEGLFAVVRRLPQSQSARDVVQDTVDSWILPRQIASVDQVDPGTWIIAEAMGAVAVKVGAQLGYSYNWVREARLGGLTGDIGLRLQMGINAAVGFSASGRCAIVVSRESEAKRLRLRLFKLKSRQFDVSLDAAVGVQATPDTLLPDKIDDFIAAVFDTHGAQILRDLRVLEKWAKGKTPLSRLLADAGIGGAEALLAQMAGVAPDRLEEEFGKVQQTAVAFISKWHALPHRVSSTILKLVEEKVDLAGVRALAAKLATFDGDALKAFVDRELSAVDLFNAPVGRVLESLVDTGGVLSLLNRPIEDLNIVGQQIVAVLDGSAVEGVLKKFQQHLETELHLDRVRQVVTETDFAALDALLKRKLAAFLGQDQFALADLGKVQDTITLLLGRRQDYYEKALAALHTKYTAEFTAAYQSSSTRQALLDATFDFSHDAANVSRMFQDAVQGRLDTLLATPHPQVTIGAATLSHGVTRQTRVDVTLPFLTSFQSHLNESLAQAKSNVGDGGLLFSVRATDTVASNQRRSVLSVAVNIALDRPDATSVRVHDTAIETHYTLLFAKRDMTIGEVRSQITPALKTYFGGRIPDVGAYLAFLDQRAEAAIPKRPNLLGNGLISLQLTLSPHAAARAGRAWLSLPPDPRGPVYQTLSKGIQASLKRHIHDARFTHVEQYRNVGSAHIVLAYCALVPTAAVARKASDLPYWEFNGRTQQQEMLADARTTTTMVELLRRAQEVLKGDHSAQFFEPQDAADILQRRVRLPNPILDGLLFAESQVVKHAFEAGLKMGAFLAAKNTKPSEAVEALALFGSRLTEAFNADVTSIIGPGMRALGTQVFLDAALAIDPDSEAQLKETNALLSLEFLKAAAAFDADALLTAGRVDDASRAFADRIVQVG